MRSAPRPTAVEMDARHLHRTERGMADLLQPGGGLADRAASGWDDHRGPSNRSCARIRLGRAEAQSRGDFLRKLTMAFPRADRRQANGLLPPAVFSLSAEGRRHARRSKAMGGPFRNSRARHLDRRGRAGGWKAAGPL